MFNRLSNVHSNEFHYEKCFFNFVYVFDDSIFNSDEFSYPTTKWTQIFFIGTNYCQSLLSNDEMAVSWTEVPQLDYFNLDSNRQLDQCCLSTYECLISKFDANYTIESKDWHCACESMFRLCLKNLNKFGQSNLFRILRSLLIPQCITKRLSNCRMCAI